MQELGTSQGREDAQANDLPPPGEDPVEPMESMEMQAWNNGTFKMTASTQQPPEKPIGAGVAAAAPGKYQAGGKFVAAAAAASGADGAPGAKKGWGTRSTCTLAHLSPTSRRVP